jgi:predicted lipoprotein
MKKRILISVMLCLFMALSLAGCVKVVPIGHEDEVTGNVAFNASDNVESIWESKAVPELKKNAVELQKLLAESNGKLDSTAKQYGHYSMGDKGELSYIVKGEGTVTEVNQEKKAGYMTLKLNGYDGPVVVKMQIGPVYKGSAVRDCLSFIKYEDYKNQVDWAKVSQAIHDTINKTLIEKLDVKTLQGKTITFTGCFSVSGEKEILITPVAAEVK